MNRMFIFKEFDFSSDGEFGGVYACAGCGSELFEGAKRFRAGCGFPSFWLHTKDRVTLKELNTYGRNRTQLLCSSCGLHLGHLFNHTNTPTKVRYCISDTAIVLKQ